MTEQAQHSEIRNQIFSVDAVKGKRFSKSTKPLIWLETAQSTHLEAAYSPGRGCSSEAPLFNPVQYYAKSFAEGLMNRAMRLGASALNYPVGSDGISMPLDLLEIVEELTQGAASDDARIRILAFEIQQLRARSNR